MLVERSEPQRLGQNIFAQDHDCRMTSDCSKTSILQDVVAFVNVWSSNRTENYSKSFEENLVDMGARVLKYFNKHVTHVVFKDGHESVWKKAQKTGVKLVSVLWVERCLTMRTHVDESLFPAINESKHSPKNKRTHRCMKPKDFIEKTPTNNKRLKKKLDQMIREIDLKRTIGADLNLLSREEEAVGLYSSNVELVPFNHFCGMEKRLKEMKEKRENPSPTASQMSQLTSASALSLCQPDLGESPSASALAKALFADEYEIDSGGASSGGASINKTSGKYAHGSKDPFSPEAHGGQTGHHSSQEFFTRGMHLVKSPQAENGKTLLRRVRKSISKLKSQFPKRQSAKAVLHCVEESVSSCSEEAIQSYSEGSMGALNCAAADLRLCNTQSNKIVQLPLPVKSAASEMDHNLTQTNFSSNECYKNDTSPPISNLSTRTKNQLSLKENRKLWQDDFMCFKSPRNNILEACEGSDKNDVCHINEDVLACEDFFSPVNLNGKNNHRCTLGMLPPKSPSLPDIFVSGKQKRKLQEINPQNAADRTKKAKSATNVSVGEQSDACFYGQYVNAPALTGENVALQPDAAKAQKKRKSHVKNPFQYFLDESGALTNDVPERKEPGQHHQMKRLDLLQQHNSHLKPPALRHETEAFSVISLRPCDETKANEKDVQCHQEDNLVKDILKLQSVDSDLDGNPQSGPYQSSPARLRMNCFHDEKNNLIEGANTTNNCIRKNVKPTRTLVMTSMPSENQSIIIQIVKRFGGFQFSDNVCETTTHVVAGHTRRTLNVLFGIARGCWILSFNWILWSLEQGCWAPEKPFELSTQFPAATICRFERQSRKEPYLQDLFVNQPLIFISPQSKPPAPALEKLVLLCGGKVCKTLRRTGICIGQYKGRRPAGNQHLSENWILDSITKHEVCSPDNYTLE